MINKNKKLLLLTSLATLLPIPVGMALMDRFPDSMAIHFGFNGQPDGFASPVTAVFVMPLILLAGQWFLVLVSRLDKSNHNRNEKIQKVVLWVIPILCNLCSFSMYALALDLNFSPTGWMLLFMGILFAVIGNYMPKTRMNATIGIRIPSTYSSEENWNATHRLAGRLWMGGGILMAALFWVPGMWAVAVLFGIMTVMITIPMIYSIGFQQKEKAQGKELKSWKQYGDPKMQKIGKIMVPALVIFCAVILFTGNITYDFQPDHMVVDSNLYTAYSLRYDAIDDIEYRDGNMSGVRVGGYGSMRLLMGWFENEELGTYVRYTYYDPDSCIVITTGNSTVVLSGENPEETKALYETILSKIDK